MRTYIHILILLTLLFSSCTGKKSSLNIVSCGSLELLGKTYYINEPTDEFFKEHPDAYSVGELGGDGLLGYSLFAYRQSLTSATQDEVMVDTYFWNDSLISVVVIDINVKDRITFRSNVTSSWNALTQYDQENDTLFSLCPGNLHKALWLLNGEGK